MGSCGRPRKLEAVQNAVSGEMSNNASYAPLPVHQPDLFDYHQREARRTWMIARTRIQGEKAKCGQSHGTEGCQPTRILAATSLLKILMAGTLASWCCWVSESSA
jgi:hypothetical protein